MAKVKANTITKGLSGKLGQDIVFRQVDGKTVAAVPPADTDHVPSEAQVAHRKKFQQASVYSSNVLLDDEKKAAYEAFALKKGLKSSYVVAMADSMHAPEILDIDLTGYAGEVGDAIAVKVTDDFKVQRVNVEIHLPDSSSLEVGDAVLSSDRTTWIYTVTRANATLTGSTVIVKAYDLPGNLTQQEKPC